MTYMKCILIKTRKISQIATAYFIQRESLDCTPPEDSPCMDHAVFSGISFRYMRLYETIMYMFITILCLGWYFVQLCIS